MTVVRLIRAGFYLMFGLSLCCSVMAAELSAESVRAIDGIVAKALSDTGVPSASIAIVKDGRIVLAKAYGQARLEPAIEATPAMRYKIASNSKQLTATAILLLAEEHKLSLDDKVARFLPDLTRAKDVTIREVLTHTAGYSDFYADDYVPLYMQRETTADAILDGWAKKPLDFEPGSRWQYSNTGYVILGEIIEKVSGRKLIDFLRERVFDKLGMKSAIDIGATPWDAADPLPYTRYALGPARIVTAEGKGWMWAAGELAMTASDLARWDISLMRGEILKPTSLRALTTEMVLTDGTGTGYGLGLSVSQMANGHRRWAHTGGASGFLSINVTFPDDKAAITVLTNGEGLAFRSIEAEVESLLLAGEVDTDAEPSLERARALFAGLQKGSVDRSSITDDLNAYFSDTVLADFGSSLGPLGEPTSFTQTSREDRGGMVHRVFTVNVGGKVLRMETYLMPDGRFEQCLVRASAS
jgi:CubicO group peptidase (beta-lactamase class C family)